DPALYTLRVTLKSRQVAESVELKIGFRRVEMRDGCFWVNGVKVMFKGVNRHEHDERTGKVISRQSMIRDIELMKQSHINAVRTAHYPDHPLWYQLCDEYGLYVIDEANIESHAFHNFLCKDQRYAAAWLERVKRMVLRDRNHVCIVMWSLGNESGYGPNHDAAAGWLRHEDPSRPLHYEGAISKVQSQRDWWSGELATDVICPMYPEIAELEEWMETPNRSARPVILCEYSHAMGNSNGCLKEYWDLFYRYREQGLQGGFIWEWVDHGLCKQGSKGQEFWAYGGDFGDEPHDGNFVCDGLVWPDRKPHPALEEVKYLHRPVAVTRVNRQQRQVTLENQQDFNSLTDFRGSWVLEVDGKAVQTGKLPRLYAKPHQRQDIKIPWNRKRIPAVGDVCLRLTFQTVSAKAGVPRGFTAVVEQVILQKAKLRKPQLAAAARKVQITETRSALRVNDGRINAAFNPKTGGMKTLQRQGVGQLTGAPMVQIWRAPTDNDGIKIWSGQDDKNLGRWLKLGLDRIQSQLESCKVSQGKHGVEVTVASRMSGRGRWDDIQTKLKWRFTGSGVVRLEGQVQLAEALLDCPQVAVVLPLEKSFDQVQWFGLGPGENYPDRKSSAVLGQYRDQVGQMFTPYIMPQENGRRGEVRTLLLRSSECGRLSVQGDQRFGFSAIPYSTAELTAATHLHQLPASSATWLTLDVAHRGIGTQSCGPDTLDHYKLKRSEYRFGFTFSWKA
ncbi:MAG: glycoside hydrolase family 2 TIM barrel-domain containing protein, partial [Verrucomicrobiota bacterium]